jgi:hypothetical protein
MWFREERGHSCPPYEIKKRTGVCALLSSQFRHPESVRIHRGIASGQAGRTGINGVHEFQRIALVLHTALSQFQPHLLAPGFQTDIGLHHEFRQHAIHHGPKGFHDVIDQRITLVACGVVDSQARRQPMHDQAAVAQRRQHRVAIVEHLVGGGVLLAITTGGTPANAGKVELPVALGTVPLINRLLLKRSLQVRAADVPAVQHLRLIHRLPAQHPRPQLLIQAARTGTLIHEGPRIDHPLERGRDAAGLIALIAVQDDPVLLHDAGEKVGTHGDTPRRDDDRPQIIQRHRSRLRLINHLAGDEAAFLAQHGSVLEDVQDVIAHE